MRKFASDTIKKSIVEEWDKLIEAMLREIRVTAVTE